jgi:hypothetical protein
MKSIIKRLAKLEALHPRRTLSGPVRFANDTRPATDEGGHAIRIQFVDAGASPGKPLEYRAAITTRN